MVIFPVTADDSPMKTTDHWQAQAKGMIRGEMKRRNLSYRDLAGRLEKIGIKETERNIANKIARGGFTAVFFLQCMEAIGVKNLQMANDD
jgi:Domain of unknown function (DUF6471)